MNKLFRINISIPLVMVVLTSCTTKWPQFRGPDSNQLPEDKNLPGEWGEGQNVKWKHELHGRGWSSPVTWGNKVFFTEAVMVNPPDQPVLDSTGEPPRLNPSDAEYSLEVNCLNLGTGQALWKAVAFKGIPQFRIHKDNTFASESPVTDGKRIYAYFGMVGLYCYDLKGNLIWEKDLGNYPMKSNWGSATSPFAYKDLIYMQIDNEEKSFLAALDKKTGEEKWRVERDEKSNWSTPSIWKNSVRTELITGGEVKARSYDPLTGELIWELELGGGRSSSSATANGDMLFIGNEQRGKDGGTLYAVRAGAFGDISLKENETSNEYIAWSRPESGISMASPLVYNGLIYFTERGKGMFYCYDEATGEPIYQDGKVDGAKPFWSSQWAHQGRIYSLDESGQCFIMDAGKELKVYRINKLDDKFWASPAIARGGYVFRGVESLYYVK